MQEQITTSQAAETLQAKVRLLEEDVTRSQAAASRMAENAAEMALQCKQLQVRGQGMGVFIFCVITAYADK